MPQRCSQGATATSMVVFILWGQSSVSGFTTDGGWPMRLPAPSVSISEKDVLGLISRQPDPSSRIS